MNNLFVHNRSPQALNTTFESEGTTHQFKEDRFSIKKELYRGIKDNDVGKIVSRTADREEEEDFKYDEYADVHNVLTHKRKNYDDHKAATNIRKKQIQALKKEIEELKGVQNSFKESINSSKTGLSNVTNELESTRVQSEYTTFRKQIYDNILQRTKTIYLVEKRRLFDLEIDLQSIRNQHRSVVLESANKKKLEQQCRKMLASIEKVVDIEKKGREKRLSSMQSVIEKKNEAMNKRSEREREISFLVEQASNEKTSQEKEWNRLFLSNKFVHYILKNKISRELSAHEAVEKTFQRIKLATGVSQAEVFVEKYLLREQTYGELLSSISEKEPLLEREQGLNERLKEELKELMEQESVEASMSQKVPSQNHQIKKREKQLQNLSNKMISFQRQKEAFYQWAIKFVKKYETITSDSGKNRLNHYQVYPRSQLQVIYQKVESMIQSILSETSQNPQKVKQKLLENKLQSSLSPQMVLRNMRVRTEGGEIDQFQDSDVGEQGIQLQYLNEQRRNIKRQLRNKRFRIKTRAH